MTEWVGVRSRVKQKGGSWVGDVVSRANQEEVQFVGLLLEGSESFEGSHTTEVASVATHPGRWIKCLEAKSRPKIFLVARRSP